MPFRRDRQYVTFLDFLSYIPGCCYADLNSSNRVRKSLGMQSVLHMQIGSLCKGAQLDSDQ